MTCKSHLSGTRLSGDDAHLVGLDTRGVLDHGREGGIGGGEDVGRLGGAVTNVGVHARLISVIDALDHLEGVDGDENLADVGLYVRRAWLEKGVSQKSITYVDLVAVVADLHLV